MKCMTIRIIQSSFCYKFNFAMCHKNNTSTNHNNNITIQDLDVYKYRYSN